MYIDQLSLSRFRSWDDLQLHLTPGLTVLSGPNGHGKTNVVEAVDYLAHLRSHRVSKDADLVRRGCETARIGATIVNAGRELTAYVLINAKGANRAQLNRTECAPRDILGVLHAVLFSPEDLALVAGEPAERRRYIDSLMESRYPSWAGMRVDYEKIVRQRNALLKKIGRGGGRSSGARRSVSAGRSGIRSVGGGAGTGVGGAVGAPGAGVLGAGDTGAVPGGVGAGREVWDGSASDAFGAADTITSTLDVWDTQLARAGALIIARRIALLGILRPFVIEAYHRLAPSSRPIDMRYISSIESELTAVGCTAELCREDPRAATELIEEALGSAIRAARALDMERGTTTVGPHRDDIALLLGGQPARGYASHGEQWSMALSLRLASFEWLRSHGSDPVLILDDVFSSLDSSRRAALVSAALDAEQTLVTAAVGDDLPSDLVSNSVRILGVEATIGSAGARGGSLSAGDVSRETFEGVGGVAENGPGGFGVGVGVGVGGLGVDTGGFGFGAMAEGVSSGTDGIGLQGLGAADMFAEQTPTSAIVRDSAVGAVRDADVVDAVGAVGVVDTADDAGVVDAVGDADAVGAADDAGAVDAADAVDHDGETVNQTEATHD